VRCRGWLGMSGRKFEGDALGNAQPVSDGKYRYKSIEHFNRQYIIMPPPLG